MYINGMSFKGPKWAISHKLKLLIHNYQSGLLSGRHMNFDANYISGCFNIKMIIVFQTGLVSKAVQWLEHASMYVFGTTV